MIMDAVWRADDEKMCDKKCHKFHSRLKDVIIFENSSFVVVAQLINLDLMKRISQHVCHLAHC